MKGRVIKLEGEELAKVIYDRLKEHTEPVIKLNLQKEKAGILDSKIGGAFYVPQGMEPPKNLHTGEDLFLLAQLNFGEMKDLEKLEIFPERGLLQIFIAGDDDVYGCDFDDMANQAGWRIRFLEDLPEETQISGSQIYEPEWKEDTGLPLEGKEVQYRLKGELLRQTVTLEDYRIVEYIKKYCAGILPEDTENIWAFLDETAFECLEENLETFDCQIGGFPFFTQEDPRAWAEEKEDIPKILLFQLDTVDGIMWGDVGVGNFFIKEEDLKKKDFSKVWYNWDCS